MSPTTSRERTPRHSGSGLNGLYTQPATAVDVNKFKPMDPQNHQGNKESLWTLNPDQHTVNLMHNAIRAEVTKFEAMLFKLGDRNLKSWEKQMIKDWWKGHYEHVLHNNKTEDEMLHPMIRTRVAVVSEFETHYEELNHLLITVDKAICNNDFKSASEITPVWHGYRTALYPHLIEEEMIMIPLLRAYFTPEEGNKKTTEIVKSMPKIALGSLLHHIPAGKEGIMTFMARMGYSWHKWYTEVHAVRTNYRESMESKLESLLLGNPVTYKHKAEFSETPKLRPLNLNARLVRDPSNAADLASRITAELSTGRLSIQDALAEIEPGAISPMPKADRPVYVQPSPTTIAA